VASPGASLASTGIVTGVRNGVVAESATTAGTTAVTWTDTHDVAVFPLLSETW